MSIIVPPELLKIIKNANGPTMQRAASHAVQGSAPGNFRPPKFGGLVGVTRTKTATGFSAGLTGELAKGAEFGGRRRPPVTYMRRGRSVRRRTTMQFLPHNARGYALVPALRSSMKGIRNRIVEAVVKSVI